MIRRVRLTHPRRGRLLEWLETGDDERVTQHVETCERCAVVLEELSAATDAPALPTGDEFGAALREAMRPPADLAERVLQRVDARRLAEREMSLFLGLIAIPRDAIDLMMEPDPRRARRPAGHPPLDATHDRPREELE